MWFEEVQINGGKISTNKGYKAPPTLGRASLGIWWHFRGYLCHYLHNVCVCACALVCVCVCVRVCLDKDQETWLKLLYHEKHFKGMTLSLVQLVYGLLEDKLAIMKSLTIWQ